MQTHSKRLKDICVQKDFYQSAKPINTLKTMQKNKLWPCFPNQGLSRPILLATGQFGSTIALYGQEQQTGKLPSVKLMGTVKISKDLIESEVLEDEITIVKQRPRSFLDKET